MRRSVENSEDDDSGESYDGEDTPPNAQQFRSAGWHRRTLSWSPSATNTNLPLKIGQSTFTLALQGAPLTTKNFVSFEALNAGVNELSVSGSGLEQATVLRKQNGWKEISRAEFENLPTLGEQTHHTFVRWTWLAALLALLFWRWGHWILTLIQIVRMKGGTISRLPTAFSLPPAIPAQFPFLDAASLSRYTSEFEAAGFTLLQDFSIVGDGAGHTPNFCRLFANSGYHCFGEIYQFFPTRGTAQPMKCSIQSSLGEGWEIDFSTSKPKAESSLFQPRKIIRVNMPEATTSELLQEFLKMRQQVCLDLGVSPERDDTLEGYIRKVQRAANGMWEAVKMRNFAVGLSQVYLRKFSLLRTRQEYAWLGDYPKEAERRRQGYLVASK